MNKQEFKSLCNGAFAWHAHGPCSSLRTAVINNDVVQLVSTYPAHTGSGFDP